MAITTVNPRYEGFIFDGENSRDYGIYVQDVKVFGAPVRDVEMVSIPGRDGEFVLDKGRFNNIQVVYTCAFGTGTQTDFNTGISDFRNWLASRKGYKRLEDEINTDEYRMAVFKDGLDVSTLNKETGTFEVTFDCKPQRFLKSGEEPTEIGGEPRNPQTASGAVVTFENDGTQVFSSIEATITPNQAGSGTPSPDNVRAITGWTGVNVYVSPTTDISDATITTTSFGTTVYGGTVDVVSGVLTVTWGAIQGSSWTQYNASNGYKAYRVSNVPQAVFGRTGISNMISEYGSFNSGAMTKNIIQLPDSTRTAYMALDENVSASDVQLIYELATPTTTQLTPAQVSTLLGTNNVWADTGNVEVTWGEDPNSIVNQTLFESHPLLEVDGYGAISINGEEVVLHNEPLGIVQLGGGGSYKNSLTYHFDQSQFNAGDFITVPDYRRTYQFDMVKPYGSGQITDFQYTSMTAADYIFNATKYQGSLTLLTDASIFSVGTARSDEYRIAGKLLFDDRTGTAYQADVVMATSVIYDGAGTIRFTASVSYADGNGNFTLVSVAGNAPHFYGDSTWRPVTDTAYIDLDIGEAYIIDNGNVVGINNVVDMPTELPTLKPAHNTITFDNTITKLVILPRWWKV